MISGFGFGVKASASVMFVFGLRSTLRVQVYIVYINHILSKKSNLLYPSAKLFGPLDPFRV